MVSSSGWRHKPWRFSFKMSKMLTGMPFFFSQFRAKISLFFNLGRTSLTRKRDQYNHIVVVDYETFRRDKYR